MYIKKLIYRNVGPIIRNKIDFRFSSEGKPIPVIVVGENGTGKSVFLSNITDAFYELAGTQYNNALEKEGYGHQYYKFISADQITIGASYLVAYMEFEQDNEKLEYVFKSGSISFPEFVSEEGLSLNDTLNWKEEINAKKTRSDKNTVEKAFEKEIVASFSPMRYEKPSWMGDKYQRYQDKLLFTFDKKFNGYLYNPITVECNSEKTLSWLFDIITDSRADLQRKDDNGYTIVYPTTTAIDLLSISRKNAEKLMSAILGQNVSFRMGNRSNKGRRLQICDSDGNAIVPSIDALSTGQLALFNLFSSIIRYADNDDINLSFRLEEIKGIVLIDEIELHLHSKLQKEVLPRLIALFPQVQFIITSHSPLFLLGMKDTFGEENIDILEMPMATKILAEDFSEFGKAYQYYTETLKYREGIKDAIETGKRKNKPLIITEGSTDWKHMKAAFEYLKGDERCSEWLPQLEFDFLEYEPLNSNTPSEVKIQMSCSELVAMCQSYSKLKQENKLIFIADNDDVKTKKALDEDPFKRWGNNVYSLCLPVPEHRHNSEICIEHLYTDGELKQKVELQDGIERRIFLGSEFDESGHIINEKGVYFCNAMQNQQERIKNAIIDGSDKKKVIKIGEEKNINYALPKSVFAEYTLNKTKPFNNLNFDSFIPLFEKIRDILNDNTE